MKTEFWHKGSVQPLRSQLIMDLNDRVRNQCEYREVNADELAREVREMTLDDVGSNVPWYKVQLEMNGVVLSVLVENGKIENVRKIDPVAANADRPVPR